VVELALNQNQVDALREISSIAAGNAATSLSIMLGKKVTISVPTILVEASGKIPEAIGGEETIVSVVYFSISGQLSGSMLLILSVSESLRLINILTGHRVNQTERIDEIGISALKELGNITIGTYLRTLGQALNLRITHSIPGFSTDMLSALLDGTLAGFSLKAEYVVMAENKFLMEKDVYRGHLVFILEPDSLHFMLRALQEKAEQNIWAEGGSHGHG
jgi:chemotaxis protein CheC